MNKILFIISLSFFNILLAQFHDDFNDGDFTSNPTWIGDVDSFEVLNNILHLNAPANSSESYLSCNSLAAVNGYWAFEVQLNFNPSSSNKLQVYIMSDTSDLRAPLHGYFIEIGGSGDQVNLYKQTGTVKSLLIEGSADILNTNQVAVKVKLLRDGQGNFELFADTSQSFNNYTLQGSALDFEYTSSGYFGLLCDYTATRSDKFWLDNVVVTAEEYVDVDAPLLLNHTLLSLDKISFTFNEPLDALVASSLSSFSLSNNAIYNVDYLNGNLVVHLQHEMPNNMPLNINLQVPDLLGNVLDTTLTVLVQDNYPFQYVWLNEIYPDESPSFGMPNGEFIEIYNPGLDTVLMSNWKIADATDTVLIPATLIYPEAFILLCKSNVVAAYSLLAPSIAVPNLPSLNNTGDNIQLLNAYDKVIDSVYYKNTWYRDLVDSLGNEKKSGGYSLERVNPQAACSNYYNWYPSLAMQGASPGQVNTLVNTVFPSLELAVEEIVIENDTTLLVHLNEQVQAIDLQNCFIEGVEIEQVYMPTPNELYVLLAQGITSGNSYRIELSGVQDCLGGMVAPFSFDFHLYEPAVYQDLVFNEVLFNPKTGGSDFIELYNRSNKVIDLEGFVLVEYDVFNPNEGVDSIVLIALEILPKSYLVLTKDTSSIYMHYIVENPQHLMQHDIPNLNDDESLLALYLPNGNLMDSLAYHKSWHLDLLDSDEGVSLERISSEEPSNDRDNWHSAARSYAYGTPTAVNSQNFLEDFGGQVSVVPEVFTPNEDGYKDFCRIHYQSSNKGELLNIGIYDLQGREVRLIAQNHSVGSDNTWKWNGLNNNFEKADVGIYVVLVEVFNVDGKRKKYKQKLVLGTQLN